MRFSPAAVSLALLVAMTASAGQSRAPVASTIAPLSVALADEGAAARRAGQLDRAIGLYESALAADPANVAAYVALGDIARAQKLAGKAVRHYRDALTIDPASRAALAGEGLALADRGAVEQAQAVLSRLGTLCGSGCSESKTLADAIAAARARPARSAAAVTPTVTTGPDAKPSQQ